MNCQRVHDALDDGFTSAGIDVAADVHVHLEACAECKAYYDELTAMVELLHPLDNLELTPNESSTLMAGLEKAAERTDRKRPVYQWAAAILRPAMAVAMVMIIMFSAGPNLPGLLVLDADMENLEFSQTETEEILSYMINDNVDLVPELIDPGDAAYITGQVTSAQAEDIFDDLSTEEINWLMDNFTLEI
ncbi:MAG: hypothetical protein GY841_02090 [FCB group bacterium]|nr:hypothetical protein [FCB group bacterium]